MIYAGAGPGLFTDLEKIGFLNNRGKGLLVSSDTALGPLLSRSIIPDLLLCTDAGPGTLYHLENALRIGGPSIRTIPVLSWIPGPLALSLFFDRIFYYRSSHPVDQILAMDSTDGIPQWTNPTRNQAGLSLLLAAFLGVKKVFLAGTGFEKVRRMTHVEGSGYRKYAIENQTRTSPAEAYEPGGYSDGRVEKSRVALEGIRTLAGELELQIRMPGEGSLSDDQDGTDRQNQGLDLEALSVPVPNPLPILLEKWMNIPWESTGWEITAGKREEWRSGLIQKT